MGQYGAFLSDLLRPLGIYDLEAGSAAESEVYALGEVLDQLAAQLERSERESHPVTAEEHGLQMWETLFGRRGGMQTAQQRRETILSLMQIGADDLTPAAVNRTLRSCGIRAEAAEDGEGRLLVRFPDTVGVPENFREVQSAVLDILPCHLEVEFVFRFLTWAELEAQRMTWGLLEVAGHTWDSLENAAPDMV